MLLKRNFELPALKHAIFYESARKIEKISSQYTMNNHSISLKGKKAYSIQLQSSVINQENKRRRRLPLSQYKSSSYESFKHSSHMLDSLRDISVLEEVNRRKVIVNVILNIRYMNSSENQVGN